MKNTTKRQSLRDRPIVSRVRDIVSVKIPVALIGYLPSLQEQLDRDRIIRASRVPSS